MGSEIDEKAKNDSEAKLRSCGLCGEALVNGELTAHRECHQSEHTRAYIQDKEKKSLTTAA